MTSVTTNGITIHYDSFGAPEAEAMVLIAGLGTQMIRWPVPFCEKLAARGYRVIRFDNRDAGLSTHFPDCPAPDFATLAAALAQGRRPNVPYTLHDMAADTVGLLDALAISRAHLVGRSMGGMIAQLVASDHAQRVRSLTSIMSSTGNPALPPAAPDIMAMLTRPAPNPFADEAGFLAHGLGFARCIAGPGHPFDTDTHRALILAETIRAYNPAGFGRQIAAIGASGDIRSRLAQITAPTLVIHGTHDRLVPPACGEDTAANIAGAELMPIAGMGHDLPPPVYREVIDAIAALAARAG
ncbi:alpha/beta fold hydrolase [Rhodopseudomonas sp. P2A-2r]|uniref:alpha/beta fold hydrolase n=1 Tax=unclassified Rhodopseudomonas TaxID=2638247 RepID=UPI002234A126|nr:alpha/beta hydrolase [Rhodopseudomonas sp. P2A-2r]UZE48757.1 alpha/beta fold hydrolase [Rhodopseudomonas sp. P2A-2r]